EAFSKQNRTKRKKSSYGNHDAIQHVVAPVHNANHGSNAKLQCRDASLWSATHLCTCMEEHSAIALNGVVAQHEGRKAINTAVLSYSVSTPTRFLYNHLIF
ncbi:unnamed protein product, partial [Citrullus colocynthis]